MTCCLDIAVITSKVRSNSRLLLRSLLNACNDISVYHCCVGISYTKGSFNFSDWDNVNVTYIDIITKWLLVENSELRLIFEGMSFITLFKAINREPFPVCWYRFPNLEATYTKVNLTVLNLTFGRWNTLGGVSGVILVRARNCPERIIKQERNTGILVQYLMCE